MILVKRDKIHSEQPEWLTMYPNPRKSIPRRLISNWPQADIKHGLAIIVMITEAVQQINQIPIFLHLRFYSNSLHSIPKVVAVSFP